MKKQIMINKEYPKITNFFFFFYNQEVQVCAWHADNFMTWNFGNSWKFEDVASFWHRWSENSTVWAQNNHWVLTARDTRCFLTVWKRNRWDWWIKRFFDWIPVDEDFTFTADSWWMITTAEKWHWLMIADAKKNKAASAYIPISK